MTEHSPLLGPVVALVGWSILVLFYMAFARYRGIKQAGLQVDPSRGGRGQDLEGRIDPRANWPAHNYTHLVEQPTLFYAVVLALALMGSDHGVNVALAWTYVVLRVAHSLVQTFLNDVRFRFALFLLSTLALAALTIHAALELF